MRIVQEKLVFETIPGRPSSHCATLTETSDGTILACWYAGTYEGHPDVAIMLACFSPQNNIWSPPVVLHDTPGLSDGNPLLYTLPDGSLILWFVTIQSKGWDTARPFWQRSCDNGQTWTPPARFGDRDGVMFRCRPVRLSSGRLILPAYDEIACQGLPLLSDDKGQTWREAARMTAPPGCIQPAIVELQDGSLLAYLRTCGPGGWIWESRSLDGGESWTPCAPTALPNPNSGIDLIRLADGRLLLAYNPISRGRSQLAIALSEDEGRSWRTILLENEPQQEFSYPALLQARSGHVHLLYTFKRQTIKHILFDVND